jgi:hypothetical protein
MSDSERKSLRGWAEAMLPTGLVQARQVLTLLDDHARLTALVQSLSERCAAQSELLSQHAEKGTVMHKININGFEWELKIGKVGFWQVVSSGLGHHQHCYLMAQAACDALGLDFEHTSPSEISEAIEHVKMEILTSIKEKQSS